MGFDMGKSGAGYSVLDARCLLLVDGRSLLVARFLLLGACCWVPGACFSLLVY